MGQKNINGPSDVKFFLISTCVYYCTSLQQKNYIMLNNSEPDILTSYTFNKTLMIEKVVDLRDKYNF